MIFQYTPYIWNCFEVGGDLRSELRGTYAQRSEIDLEETLLSDRDTEYEFLLLCIGEKYVRK